MTKELADKITKALAVDKNVYARDCNTRVAKEDGKVIGAEYMYQKLRDILVTEVNSQEDDNILKIIRDDCRNRYGCAYCPYFNADNKRCRFNGAPSEWEVD